MKPSGYILIHGGQSRVFTDWPAAEAAWAKVPKGRMMHVYKTGPGKRGVKTLAKRSVR